MRAEGCLQVSPWLSLVFLSWTSWCYEAGWGFSDFFLLVDAVCSPGHWISSLGFLSCAPMLRLLCLDSFKILNHLLHVEGLQREGGNGVNSMQHAAWEVKKMCYISNICSVNEVIDKYLYDIHRFFRHGIMQRVWDHNIFKLVPGGYCVSLH